MTAPTAKTQNPVGMGRTLQYQTTEGDTYPATVVRSEMVRGEGGVDLYTLTLFVMTELGARVVKTSSQGADGNPQRGQWAWPKRSGERKTDAPTPTGPPYGQFKLTELVESLRPMVKQIVLDLIQEIPDDATAQVSE
jgi:hypothetical protein